jgi:hypothetical protein
MAHAALDAKRQCSETDMRFIGLDEGEKPICNWFCTFIIGIIAPLEFRNKLLTNLCHNHVNCLGV